MNNSFASKLSGSVLWRYRSLLIYAVIILIVPLFLRSEYTIHTVCAMLLYAFLASSWNILGGYCGHFSLGNGVYMGFGAYITAVLFKYYNLSPWIGIIISAIIAAFVSLLLSFPCFKLRGTYYCLATIAMLNLFRLIICNEKFIFGYDLGASMGLRIPWKGGFMAMQFDSKISYYFIIALLLFIVLAYSISLKYSKSGYYFAAIKTNQQAAEALGVATTRYKLKAQFMSAFFTAIGGGVYLMFIMFLDPTRILSPGYSIEIMLYAVIGGIGTIWGPVFGAIVLFPISEGLRTVLGTSFSGVPTALYGLVMMLVVYYMPKGIFPWIFSRIQKGLSRTKNNGEAPKEG